jgi:hypothetical protein
MAAKNVIAQVLGGDKDVVDGVNNVGDVREKMGIGNDYSATLNGSGVKDDATVRDGDFVAFSRKVKGGRK